MHREGGYLIFMDGKSVLTIFVMVIYTALLYLGPITRPFGMLPKSVHKKGIVTIVAFNIIMTVISTLCAIIIYDDFTKHLIQMYALVAMMVFSLVLLSILECCGNKLEKEYITECLKTTIKEYPDTTDPEAIILNCAIEHREIGRDSIRKVLKRLMKNDAEVRNRLINKQNI